MKYKKVYYMNTAYRLLPIGVLLCVSLVMVTNTDPLFLVIPVLATYGAWIHKMHSLRNDPLYMICGVIVMATISILALPLVKSVPFQVTAFIGLIPVFTEGFFRFCSGFFTR